MKRRTEKYHHIVTVSATWRQCTQYIDYDEKYMIW